VESDIISIYGEDHLAPHVTNVSCWWIVLTTVLNVSLRSACNADYRVRGPATRFRASIAKQKLRERNILNIFASSNVLHSL
jgi:predicted secreted protein